MDNVFKLSLAGFKWVEETCQFNEDFIKSYDDIVMKDILLMFNILKIYIAFTMT